jgi:galactokinase
MKAVYLFALTGTAEAVVALCASVTGTAPTHEGLVSSSVLVVATIIVLKASLRVREARHA